MQYNEILTLRTQHSISQIKLAEYSGFSPAIISSWELNKSVPTQEQIDKLAETISLILRTKDELGIDIRKKRYRNSGKAKGEQPLLISSADDYLSRMKHVNYDGTEYNKLINKTQKQQTNKEQPGPKAIALFSGCGGMSLGFSWAGFNVLGHIDIDDSANEIYSANHSSSTLLGTDITKISDDDVKGWQNHFGDIDVIIGGPPCQGFSLAGKRNPNDERNELFEQYLRIVSIARPKVFIMENVRLMTSMKDANGSLFLDRIIEGFKKIDYDVIYQVLNAQDYGVPQFRDRVFLVGTDTRQTSNRFVFPNPTSTNDEQLSLFGSSESKIRTFRDAVRDLPLLESGEVSIDPLHWTISHPYHVIEWLKIVPEGCSAHENENPEMRPPSGFNTTYKRLVWDEPFSTISTNFNMISGCRNVHPTSTRSLTIREATRAQSFPDSYCFFGKWSDIRRVIGNAVPPLLAKAVADSLHSQLF